MGLSSKGTPRLPRCADDDDKWEPGHLAACLAVAASSGSSVVASGIIRHSNCDDDSEEHTAAALASTLPTDTPDAALRDGAPSAPTPTMRCRCQTPPTAGQLDPSTFLVSNPSVQGSNLFVRMDALFAAGLFDEALPSTTDRDLCVRLADLGLTLAYTGCHTVHHFAPGQQQRDRLSNNTGAKAEGLHLFYEWKWMRRMGSSQRAAFKRRAMDVFGIDMEAAAAPVATPAPPPAAAPAAAPAPAPAAAPTPDPVVLLLGIVSSCPDTLRPLVQDLQDPPEKQLCRAGSRQGATGGHASAADGERPPSFTWYGRLTVTLGVL